jgi:hypothetical protein
MGTMLPLCLPAARADVIYSTFNSGFPAYDAARGFVVTGSALPPGYGGVAVAFVPSGTFDVNSVDLALLHVSGTNSAVVSLHSDRDGVPGSTLGSWTVSAAPYPYGLVGILASGRVTSGQQYWISVQPGVDDTNVGWAFNNWDLAGVGAGTRDGSNYVTGVVLLPAFDVLGQPVPEPSSSIAGLAAAVLLVVKFRGARRSPVRR